MLEIGKFNQLPIKKIGTHEVLVQADGIEIAIPQWEVPEEAVVGDLLSVFVYNDQRASLKGTLRVPTAQRDDIRILTVKDVTKFGAFLDWGIQKDLFLPERNWKQAPKIGDTIMVRLLLDYEKTGIIATTDIQPALSGKVENLTTGQAVTLLITGDSSVGFHCIVENAYRGILYANEVFEPLTRGEVRKGYIKKLRDDNRIDCSLYPIGFTAAADHAKTIILKTLEAHKGFLPLHDKSTPEEISALLGLSKKIFKKTIGVLYKEGRITLEENGIRVKKA